MQQDCPECQRLWRAYGAATTAHVGLETKLKQNAPGSDPVSRQTLASEVAEAAKLRDSVRLTLQQHEATAHGAAADSAEVDS